MMRFLISIPQLKDGVPEVSGQAAGSDAVLPTSIFAAMHIAVDARYISTINSDEEQHTLTLLYGLVQFHPEHHFTIISLQTGILSVLPNITEIVITNTYNSYLGLQRWYGKTLPAMLIQTKADVLISINSATARLNIPQLIFLSSPTAAERVYTNKFLFLLYKKLINKQIAKANAIATFTQLQQFDIAKHLNVIADRIIPVGYAVPAVFKPVSWQQKETILEEYTQGREYFLYTGPFTENTFMLVLKAFSLFKKRQLSSMQLIAAGTFNPDKNVAEKLETYKYRADVKLYENADQQMMALLTSGAYAIVSLDEKVLTAFAAAAALQCGVPVIGLENSAVQQVAGSAGLYAAATPEDLAEQMKRLYKDENLRKQLVINASVQMPLVNGSTAAQNLWDCIDMDATKIRLHLPPENEPAI